MGVLVLAGAASAAWYAMAAAILREELDVQIDTDVRALASLTRWTDHGLELEFSDELVPDFLPGEDAAYFEIWRGDGSTLERSHSLGALDLDSRPLGHADGVPWNMVLPDGRPGRAIALGYSVTEGLGVDPPSPFPRAVVMVARSREALDARLATLRSSVFGVGSGLALLAGLLAYAVARLGLWPVEWLGRQVERLDPDELPASLPAVPRGGPLPTELVPIAAGLDTLIERIRETVAREKRVAANVAHELRTPVTELLSVTEVALRWPDEGGFRDKALESALEIGRRMQALTNTVLRLAQAEAAVGGLAVQPIEIGPFVRETWDSARAGAAETADGGRRAELDCGPEGLTVHSDPTALRLVLSNLMDNALQYGDRDRPVRCVVAQTPSGTTCEIANGAAELTEVDVARLTERFWRKDATRTPSGRTHLGLGTTLASEICRRLSIALSYRLDDGELIATLRFPVH